MSQYLVDWAVELQSIAQIGITYAKDVYDTERYRRIREISAEIMSKVSGLTFEKVRSIFCNEEGYQTPKLDTRAAIFKDDTILLVKENNGKWSLPGGWVDVNLSIKENIIKEVKEETGFDIIADKIIAIQDRSKHNFPKYAYGVCKIFILCSVVGGKFQKNNETEECKYFPLKNLPKLSTDRNTLEQIQMCFNAYSSEKWDTEFD